LKFFPQSIYLPSPHIMPSWKCEISLSTIWNQQITRKWYFMFTDRRWWIWRGYAWETEEAGRPGWEGK
jgi:hypothetical protein